MAWKTMYNTPKQFAVLKCIVENRDRRMKIIDIVESIRATGIDISRDGVRYNLLQFIEQGYVKKISNGGYNSIYSVTASGVKYLNSLSNNAATEEDEVVCSEEEIDYNIEESRTISTSDLEKDDLEKKEIRAFVEKALYPEECDTCDFEKSVEIVKTTSRTNRYVADESTKKEAITDTINETLSKTLSFCQSLAVQLDTGRSEKVIGKLQEEIDTLNTEVRRLNMIIESFYTDRRRCVETVPSRLGELKAAINDYHSSFFSLLPWAQQQNKNNFLNDIITECDEAIEDIMATVQKLNQTEE